MVSGVSSRTLRDPLRDVVVSGVSSRAFRELRREPGADREASFGSSEPFPELSGSKDRRTFEALGTAFFDFGLAVSSSSTSSGGSKFRLEESLLKRYGVYYRMNHKEHP